MQQIDALLARFSLHALVAIAMLLVFLMLLDMQITILWPASMNLINNPSLCFTQIQLLPGAPVDLQKTMFIYFISELVLSIAYQLNLSFNMLHAGPFFKFARTDFGCSILR